MASANARVSGQSAGIEDGGMKMQASSNERKKGKRN
jgi:hypothetical protein